MSWVNSKASSNAGGNLQQIAGRTAHALLCAHVVSYNYGCGSFIPPPTKSSFLPLG
jgi:hypothetical protein